MLKRLYSHLRQSAERHFKDWPKNKLPSQEKLIDGKTWSLAWLEKICKFQFLGKAKPNNTQCVPAIAQTLTETDLLWKAYCSLCTDTASYDTNVVSCGADTVSYSSSGKKGLPGLCSVLTPVPNVDVFCCSVTRTVLSVLSHTLCTITRTTFSELPQALCWSSIVFSVTRAVISLLPMILWCHSLLVLDILFPGAVTMTKLAFLLYMLSVVSCSCPRWQAHMIWPEKKVTMCATFVVYVRSIESLDIGLSLGLVCSPGRKS